MHHQILQSKNKNILIGIIATAVGFLGISLWFLRAPTFASTGACGAKCVDLGYGQGICRVDDNVGFDEESAGVCKIKSVKSNCVCSAR